MRRRIRKRILDSLHTMKDAQEIAANMLLNGDIDPKTANAILYACNVCLGAIRVDEQQAKLIELEKMVREFEQNGNL